MNTPLKCTTCGAPCNSTHVFLRDDLPFLPTLLRNNEPPTGSMIGPLRSSALRVSATIDEIQAEILRTSDFLKALQDKRRHLQLIEEDYKAVLSPVRRVPSEVLAEIFYACSGNEKSEWGYNVFHVKAGPWVLSRVCRLWRQVSRSLCPSSWATFSVPVLQKLRKDPISLLKAALSHCGNRRLKFIFHGPRWDSRDVDMEVRRTSKSLFQILLSLSHRWKSVDLDITQELFQLLPSVRGKVSCLETCIISTGPITESFNALEFAPNLKCLTFKGLRDCLLPVPVSTSNLVKFSDDRATDYFGHLHQMYLDIVRGSPSLEEFEVRHQGQAEGDLPVATPRIIHPTLYTLAIREGSFMRSLELPELESVDIQKNSPEVGDRSTFPDVLPALHDLIIRSRCSLTYLSIADTVLDDNIISILSLSPQLAYLGFSFTQWSEDSDFILQTVIEKMAETTINSSGDNELSLIPLLEEFSVYMFDRRSRFREVVEVGFVDGNFVNMLKVRLDYASPLQFVTVNGSTRFLRFTGVDSDDVEQLVKWRDENRFEELAIQSGFGPTCTLHRVV
ncbi:hypothetical protein ARMSODRAFT_330237 [Armillaria solidipes]|uniref:F-box domain-containing protein n=1 Tax=Armillaria solidipes TaxID=1076256 RepID=A0A2H3BB30_9AGAR|nr:hypothetical protein ARMSODRAFT_330237 [Armillaria solidipes]